MFFKIKTFLSIFFLKLVSSEEPKCGIPSVKPVVYGNVLNRIINGQNAIDGSWPWIVSLRRIENDGSLFHLCGGSLIDLNLVLTAAHCLATQKINSIVIVVDTYNIRKKPNNSNMFYPKSFKIHSNYNNSIFQHAYDIALIKLTQNITLSNTVRIICLPGPNETSSIYNKFVFGIGW